eukprot:6212363-Pleurochrysis_carterae.AAC.2
MDGRSKRVTFIKVDVSNPLLLLSICRSSNGTVRLRFDVIFEYSSSYILRMAVALFLAMLSSASICDRGVETMSACILSRKAECDGDPFFGGVAAFMSWRSVASVSSSASVGMVNSATSGLGCTQLVS